MKYKLFIILAVVLFSSYPTISKLVMAHNHPLVVLFMTGALSTLILLFVFGILPEVKKLLRFKKQDPYLFIIAILAGALAPAFNLFGLQHSSVLNLVLISSIQVPAAAFLSFLILKEKITASYIMSLLFLAVGITIYSTQFFQTSFHFTWNDLFFVGASCSFALADVLYKKKISHMPHELVLIVRNAIGTIAIFLIMLVMTFGSQLQVSFDHESLIGIGLIVLLPIIAAQSLWYLSLEKVKNTDAALLTSLYPMFAALIAFFALGEGIAWYQMLGGAIMILGLIVSHLHFSRHKVHKDHIHLQGFKHH